MQVVFARSGDPYRQRQVVTERLAETAGVLPEGTGAPLLSPLSSSMEYLWHSGYTSDRLSAVELRDIVQWIVKPQILAVPGVAQAQIFGGAVRERQIEVDPVKLAAVGLTLDDVVATAKRATKLIGGGYLENSDAAHRDPRGRTWARRSRPSAALSSVRARDYPVRLRDVAEVRDGAEPRFGDALIAGKPAILIETSTQFGAPTRSTSPARSKSGSMRSHRRSPSRASSTIRRCCVPRVSSRARSRSCATRSSSARCSWSRCCS